MTSMAPAQVRLVEPEWVDIVPAPAHDSLTPKQRRQYLADNPNSYLGVTRSPEDAANGETWDAALAVANSRTSLQHLLDIGAFGPPLEPAYYLYRLSQGDHSQTGIVACVSIEDYDRGRVRIHEQIRAAQANHLKAQLTGVGVQSSPIALAYRSDTMVEGLVARTLAETDPIIELTSADGVSQQVFRVETDVGQNMQSALAEQPLYLIDGHHRAAATSLARAEGSSPGAEWMFCTIFSATDLRNEAFHRVLVGVEPSLLLADVMKRFPTREAAEIDEVLNRRADEVGLLTRSGQGQPQWHLVTLPALLDERLDIGVSAATPLLAELEPVRLCHHIIDPYFADDGPGAGREPTINYLHGLGDRDDIERLTAEVSDPLWLMRPISLETVMNASDLGATLPAKSTYFQPKVRSGIFIRSMV